MPSTRNSSPFHVSRVGAFTLAARERATALTNLGTPAAPGANRARGLLRVVAPTNDAYAVEDPEANRPAGDGDDTPPADDVDDAPRATWSGVIGMEGAPTGDGRLIEPGALSWETPVPLRYVPVDTGGHDGAHVAGRILSVTRGEGGRIIASGDFDLGGAAGREALRMVHGELMQGVSMDLDDISFQIRVAPEVVDGEAEPVEVEVDAPIAESDEADTDDEEADTEDDGRITVVEINSTDEIVVMTDARVRGVTMVSIPAFIECSIAVDEMNEAAAAMAGAPPEPVPADDGGDAAALVAGAAPVRPPAAWFAAPNLAGPTPVTVTDDGRVYGHLATWDTCHVGFQGECMSPPATNTDYAYFRVGCVMTDAGTEVPTGTITMDTLHARPNYTAPRTLAHYEHTGRAVADVAAGEDAHGIWVAGALRPTVTDEQVRALRGAPLSGDWRAIGGNLELVAALAVNVPGFPVPRPAALVAGGAMRSLVASGMLPPRQVLAPGTPGALSTDDLRYLKRLADRERSADRDRAAQGLAARMRAHRAATLAARVLNIKGKV